MQSQCNADVSVQCKISVQCRAQHSSSAMQKSQLLQGGGLQCNAISVQSAKCNAMQCNASLSAVGAAPRWLPGALVTPPHSSAAPLSSSSYSSSFPSFSSSFSSSFFSFSSSFHIHSYRCSFPPFSFSFSSSNLSFVPFPPYNRSEHDRVQPNLFSTFKKQSKRSV